MFHAVDSHTEGMPTRVIVGGVGTIPGDTMFDRRRYFMANLDGIRKALMYEPRGHAAMSGAILQPPSRPDADWGVVYIEVSGCLPMCGHGTIGVATVLVETGMVEVTEPVTRVRLDTPAGLVVAEVSGPGRRRRAASAIDQRARVHPRPGPDRDRRPATARSPTTWPTAATSTRSSPSSRSASPFDRANKEAILTAGLAVMAAINEQNEPVHPENPEIRGCHHVQFLAPDANAQHSRHAMAIYPGWFDRSPVRHRHLGPAGPAAHPRRDHGRRRLRQRVVHRLPVHRRHRRGDHGRAGVPAVIPQITGRAWITGTAQYMIDPTDPFPEGFQL